jgi:hypothetical protein
MCHERHLRCVSSTAGPRRLGGMLSDLWVQSLVIFVVPHGTGLPVTFYLLAIQLQRKTEGIADGIIRMPE